jgi:HK97 gp10 family phage protein
MARVAIKVEGVKAINRDLKELGEGIHKTLIKSMGRVVKRVSSHAKAFAPVDTGYLKRNITPSVIVKGLGVRGIVEAKNTPYAIYVEFGSQGRSPNKFFTRALDGNRVYIEETLKRAVNLQISKTNRSGKIA